jgi:diaminopimelate decarboxylase
VVSEMEFDMAIKNGVNPKNIVVNGPIKTKELIKKTLFSGSLLQIDNLVEWNKVKGLIENNRNQIFRIGLRVNFDLNDEIKSRFGLSIHCGDFEKVLLESKYFLNIKLETLHIHIINQNREPGFFASNVAKLIQVKKNYNLNIECLNIGGGFFSQMNSLLADQFNMPIPSIEEYGRAIGKEMNRLAHEMTLYIEPGAILVADTTSFACKITAVKQSANGFFAFCSGSKYNIMPTLHNKQMPFERIGNNDSRVFDKIEISGYTCKEDDVLISEYCGPLGVDDVFIFHNLGAYVTVFKPPFIEPDFAMYALEDNKVKCIRSRQLAGQLFSSFV